MSLWVHNEKKLTMQCSKIISKDVRAVRNDCTTQEPRRALKITRLLFEILLLCLRRTGLERKSTDNNSKNDENPAQVDPKLTENRSCAILGAQGRFGDVSRRARHGFWTPKCRPKADLGAPRASQERPGAVQKRRWGTPETLQEPRGHLPRRSQRRSRRRTQSEALADRFWIDFQSMRRSSEVCFVLVFTVFFRCRTFFALIARRAGKSRKNRRFGLENRGSGRQVGPGTAFWAIYWRQVSPGTAFLGACWRQVGPGTAFWTP